MHCRLLPIRPLHQHPCVAPQSVRRWPTAARHRRRRQGDCRPAGPSAPTSAAAADGGHHLETTALASTGAAAVDSCEALFPPAPAAAAEPAPSLGAAFHVHQGRRAAESRARSCGGDGSGGARRGWARTGLRGAGVPARRVYARAQRPEPRVLLRRTFGGASAAVACLAGWQVLYLNHCCAYQLHCPQVPCCICTCRNFTELNVSSSIRRS